MKTIYHGGQVFTGSLPLAQAFAVEDGRFLAAGTDEELLALRAEGDVLVDLAGRFVCPGFNDSHMHLVNYGNLMNMCDLTGSATVSLAAVQSALRAFAASHPEGWIIGRGWNQDYFSPATDIPTRHDLDAVCADRPICITRCCGHCLVVNTCALDMLGIDASTPVPEGGAIDQAADGSLTGVFRDTAMVMIQTRLPKHDKAALKQMIRQACAGLNALGVTSCQSDDFCAFENVDWRDVLAAFQEVEAEGDLTVRVYEQSQFTTPAGLQSFLDMGYTTGTGSELFKIGPLKLLGDGSLGARTAYLSGTYADAPGEKGLAIFTQEQFNELITLAHTHNMDAAIHAIGDGILDMILNAYEYAFAQYDRPHRSGIVHVQLTREDQLARMKQLGMHAYAQTIFLDYDSHIVRNRAGSKLASTSYAFRTMQSLGLHVSGGTDCPVEAPDPMRGVQCAVTRQPLDGSLPPYRPEEAMTVAEALRSYTSEGAYASFEEGFKGRIAPGMAADFTVLSGDPFAVAPREIAGIRAVRTVLAGKTVYAEGGI